MPITKEDVAHIAKLAHLEITEEELEKLEGELLIKLAAKGVLASPNLGTSTIFQHELLDESEIQKMLEEGKDLEPEINGKIFFKFFSNFFQIKKKFFLNF